MSSLQICCDGPTLRPLETWVQPILAWPVSAHRTCGASPYIPSGL